MTVALDWIEFAARDFEVAQPPIWRKIARPEQLAPEGQWLTWAYVAGRGAGKMLGMDTPIPTPTGWSKLGDLKVGDELFDEAGRITRITAVYDGMPSSAWRLTFSDGATIDACGEHQWVTWTHAERKAYLRSEHEADTTRFPEDWPQWQSLRRPTGATISQERAEEAIELHKSGLSFREVARRTGVTRQILSRMVKQGGWAPKQAVVRTDSTGPQIRTTDEIVATMTYGSRGDTNHSIPVTGALQLPKADLPIDPYILGYWLGDGASAGGTFTCHPDDQPGLYDALAAAGFTPHARLRGHANTVGTNGLTKQLRLAGLLRNKHVPAAYLRASVQQRTDLLRGLMDSDGYAGRSGVEFCSTTRALADAVVELAISLGQKAILKVGRATLNGKDCGPKYRVTWRPTMDVFRLDRKREALPAPDAQGLRHHHRMIVSAEPIPLRPMRCLTVDSKHSMYLAGDAMIPTHNTRSAAEWVHEKAMLNPGVRIALVGRTPADVRDVMIEGESGIVAIAHGDAPNYQSTKRRLTWPNGSTAHTYSAEVPSQLRGPQHHFAWCDEPAAWTDAPKGDALDTAWNNLVLGLRLGQDPQCVFTTTPKPNALIRTILSRSSTVVTRGSTYDNLGNLAPSFRAEVLATYEGTRIGRQELLGELLDDVEGALWTIGLLDENRVQEHPDLQRIVVAVDPSGGTGPNHDEQGIVVVGLGVDGELYVLADRSCSLSPHGWASRAVGAYREFSADRIVAEINYGGAMVESTIRQIDKNVAVEVITASRGKVQRAEPVAALYEQHRVHHLGAMPKLEDQMTTWTPQSGTSPDRMDALVWAVTELTDDFNAAMWIEYMRRKAEATTDEPAGNVEAEAALAPATAPVPQDDPAAARQRARNAAYRAQR